jgi:NhaP-type Na+/H+ or K+/H+ antiporter
MLNVIMLNVIMLNVIMLNAIILNVVLFNVVMLYVVAPTLYNFGTKRPRPYLKNEINQILWLKNDNKF